MCFASGKMALRVRMEIDLLTQRLDFLSRFGNPLPDPVRRSAPHHIMNSQHRRWFQVIMKALIEYGIESMQLFQRQILKLAMLVHAQLYCFADLLVRETR